MIRLVLACLLPPALAAQAVPPSLAPTPAHTAQDAREAEAMVFRAFPEADACRRIVRPFERAARAELERRLPFQVHFDEVGAHTLYVAFRGRRPVGLLYLRTEEAEWGFTEIRWAFGLDLRVMGFQFQRGRSSHQQALERSPFGKSLIGRNYASIEALHGAKGEPPPPLDGVPAGAEALAKICLRSAMKALLVTELVWSEEIAKLADLAMGFDAFPAAERWRREVWLPAAGTAPAGPLLGARIMHAFGTGQGALGAAIRVDANIGGRAVCLHWVIDAEQRVLRVRPAQSWEDDDLRAACTTLVGRPLAGEPLAGNALQPLATELGAALDQLANARRTR